MTDIAAGPCQFCMDGREKAQLVLHDGQWQPWALVCSRPDNGPMILADICPGCDRERFNAEEVPRLNDKIAARNADHAMAASLAGKLCDGCPPADQPDAPTRCAPCPRRPS